MGRQSGHHLNTTRKTYSRTANCYGTKENAGKKFQYRRKPLPNFDELFIKKKTEQEQGPSVESSFLSSAPVFDVSAKCEDKFFNADCSRSFSKNDTFDSVFMPAMCMKENKENIFKKTLVSSSSTSTNENSESDDAFLSVLHLTTTKVSEMFVTSPIQNKKKKKRERQNILGEIKTPQNVNTNSVLTPISKPEMSMITSTPLLVPSTENKFLKGSVIENELSPVDKDKSCILEISDKTEPDSQYISCYLQQPMSNDLCGESSVVLKSLPDCFVSLEKLDEKNLIKTRTPTVKNSGLSVSEDLFKSDNSDDNVQSFSEPISNSFLRPTSPPELRTSFFRITRRRKSIFDHLKFRSKRNALVNLSKSSLASPRKFSKSSYSTWSRLSSNANASKFKQSDIEHSRLSSTSSQTHSCKAGKGWRRSVRKRSIERRAESFCSQESIHSVIAEKEALHNTSRDKLLEVSLSLSILEIESHSDDLELDPRSFVLNLCHQESELTFEKCFSHRIDHCKKIGEGLYGEVFLCSDDSGNCKRVLKIMPIEGNVLVNDEPQKTFVQIAPEIVVSKALSDLNDTTLANWTSCFAGLHQCWCVKGAYMPQLLDLWDAYASKKGSENDRPDFYTNEQMHIILEFEFAGEDLESFKFNNATQAYSAFMQIVFSLAVAEAELEFEHRDLHWGNVLISQNSNKIIEFNINDKTMALRTNGVKATLIDFTLSRLKSNGKTFFNDLSSDPSLFTAEGDYQFEVYRLMQKANGNNWKTYNPITNIYWLHYILKKMVLPKGCHYKNVKAKIHKEGIKKLTELMDKITDYSSALEFALDCTVEMANV